MQATKHLPWAFSVAASQLIPFWVASEQAIDASNSMGLKQSAKHRESATSSEATQAIIRKVRVESGPAWSSSPRTHAVSTRNRWLPATGFLPAPANRLHHPGDDDGLQGNRSAELDVGVRVFHGVPGAQHSQCVICSQRVH